MSNTSPTKTYLNQFQKESTEKSLKAIAEMKKSPIDLKKELERHKEMQKTAAQMEENLITTVK